MAILNYSTTVGADKSISEIEMALVRHNVKSVMKNYEDGQVIGLSFVIDTGYSQVPVCMPARIDACLKVLQEEKKKNPRKNIKATKEQAEWVAWRILKDWTEAQMALIDIQMAKTEEIFMPYIVDQTGKTLFQKLEKRQFLLEEEW